MASSLSGDKATNVLRQVEFYFSDSNLPRDNFLKKTVKRSVDGLVSLNLICSFSRMRSYLELGSMKADEVPEKIVSAVAETLRKSPFLKVSEDGKRVGRSTDLSKPEEIIEQVDSRTIAASPFPFDVTLEDVEVFFSQFGKPMGQYVQMYIHRNIQVNSVRLPHHIANKKHFCGTALVEFSQEEEAKKVFKESFVYGGAELEIIPKKVFDAEIEEKRKCRKTHSNKSAGSYPKGVVVALELKGVLPERHKDQTDLRKNIASFPQNRNHAVKEKIRGNIINDEVKTSEDNKMEDEDEANQNQSQGAEAKTIADASLETEENDIQTDDKNVITREDLKIFFERFGVIKFVDYQVGKQSGYICFEEPEAAVKARAIASIVNHNGLKIKSFIARLEALSGEAEREYWVLHSEKQETDRELHKTNKERWKNEKCGSQSGGKHALILDSGDGNPHKAQKVD